MAYTNELGRALARQDAGNMCRQLDAYASYYESGCGEWPDEFAEDFDEIISSHFDDPE